MSLCTTYSQRKKNNTMDGTISFVYSTIFFYWSLYLFVLRFARVERIPHHILQFYFFKFHINQAYPINNSYEVNLNKITSGAERNQ